MQEFSVVRLLEIYDKLTTQVGGHTKCTFFSFAEFIGNAGPFIHKVNAKQPIFNSLAIWGLSCVYARPETFGLSCDQLTWAEGRDPPIYGRAINSRAQPSRRRG